MATKKVTVPELGTIHLYKRRRSKSMRLSVTHSGDIRVSLPYWVPYRLGVEFAQKRSRWLIEHRPLQTSLSSGQQVGKAHRLVFEPGNVSRVSTRVNADGSIKVMYPKDLDITDTTVQSAAEKACIRALKLQAQNLLLQRISLLASQHGFSYRTVTIKRLSSRWGSCSNDQHVILNCYLMQLPWHLIDYVLLHELTHTRVMAHGPTFWTQLSECVPNLKDIKKEIRQYQPKLINSLISE